MESRSVTVRQVAKKAARDLTAAGVPEPEASAEVLLSELLGIRRGEVPFHGEPLTERQSELYAEMISARKAREPVQRILGYAYFRNLTLKLNDDTLIPRPDTESVVDLALRVIDESDIRRVLDIGTGTGAIAVSIARERPATEVHASDISETALQMACVNAEENGADVEFHVSDIASGLQGLGGTVGLLVSNPPYVESGEMSHLQPEVRRWDPALALDGGSDGLSFYRRVLYESRSLLAENASVVLEVGDGQAERVLALGRDAGFDAVETHRDLAGSVRAVHLRWPGDEV